MVTGMACFAIADMCIKLLADSLPLSQIIFVQSWGGLIVFVTLVRIRGEKILSPVFFETPVVIRNIAEAFATACMTIGLYYAPLSSAASLVQAVPLLVMAGAAIVLREQVGWRRWLSAFVGLCGVIVILQPQSGSVSPALLLVLAAVVGLATRDLATHKVRSGISSFLLAAHAFGVLALLSLVWAVSANDFVQPSFADILLLGSLVAAISLALFCVTSALRGEDVSAVIGFRYTRVVFALILSVTVLGEEPGAHVYLGVLLIVASGAYALWREARVNKRQRDGVRVQG